MFADQNLIIIRGNSGSGKNTIAKELRLRQDYLRRIVLKEKESKEMDNISLIEQTVNFVLDKGYSVVLEGILVSFRYNLMIRRLAARCENVFVYYMDVTFDETLKRHRSKPESHEFGEKEMRQWWRDNDLTGLSGEKIISTESSLEQSIQFILSDISISLSSS